MTALELLNLTEEQKVRGIWFSGIKGEGEYKEWDYKDNRHDGLYLYEHSFWKNGIRQSGVWHNRFGAVFYRTSYDRSLKDYPDVIEGEKK